MPDRTRSHPLDREDARAELTGAGRTIDPPVNREQPVSGTGRATIEPEDHDRTRRFDRDGDGRPDAFEPDHGGVATQTRTRQATRTAPSGAAATATAPRIDRDTLDEARARQRAEHGGLNWGAAFFGWLVAVGMAALLTGILAAAGAAIGLTTTAEDGASAETLSIGGAVALLVALAVAYYCGGYVAGRMSRFDGFRQGIGAWIIGLVATAALAALALVAGSEYNVLERLNLPSLPIGESTLTTGGIIATAAILLGTLLAAALGGKAGERYHKKVDRAALGH